MFKLACLCFSLCHLELQSYFMKKLYKLNKSHNKVSNRLGYFPVMVLWYFPVMYSFFFFFYCQVLSQSLLFVE